jgi:hypothetical protein
MGMKKFTLVYDTLGTIHSNLELPLYVEHINIEPYQSDKTYNPKTTLYYTNSLKKTQLHDVFLNQGFRIVYDNLTEPGSNFTTDHGYVMHNQNYFWYHDSLLMIGTGHDKYQPNKTYKKLALMPMNLAKMHRTWILEKTVAHLDDLYWSYVEFGRQLPNDVSWNFSAQRHFNPQWYNDTYFSLVPESDIHKKLSDILHITEKTFKPIAFRHPFMIWGQVGTLQRLKELGFETFENLFDESYDDISNHRQRLDAVVNNIAAFNKVPYDIVTMQKLQHNHARFFDRALVEHRIKTEIIDPLLEYLEST